MTPPASDAVDELLGLVRDHFRFLNSPSARARRQIAAAGLARGHALLSAMALLRRSGRRDVVGTLTRALSEVWLVSLYVLHRDADPDDNAVLAELAADSAVRGTTLANSVLPGTPGATDLQQNATAMRQWAEGQDVPIRKVVYQQLAARLDAVLIERKLPLRSVPNARYVYETMYRCESTYDAHAAFGVLGRYLQYDDARANAGVIECPGPSFPGNTKSAALLLYDLAEHVFREFKVVVRPPMTGLLERLFLLDETEY